MTEKQGVIDEIVFHNSDNGYTIAIVINDEEEFTAVGCLPACGIGRSYILRGDYTVHPKYGEQFAFKEYEEIMPGTEEGITGFLSSGVLKGIGPKAAKSIVKKFGKETFDVIEKTPERLTVVSGIGEKKAKAISDAFKVHREFAEITLYLQQYNINADYALKLYKVYGGDTVEIIKENPYQLVDDLFGMGFRKADAIAQKTGIKKDDENRIQCGIKYMLWRYAGEGHTFCPRVELCEKTGEMLEVEREEIDENLVTMAFQGDLQIENLEGRDVVFLFVYYEAEQRVTKLMSQLVNSPTKPINAQPDSLIGAVENKTGIVYSDEQKNAIITSLENGISVITGGPGTGKTTIINGIINILEQSGNKTAVAAPTGRAAKRITETTGHPASTIHRLLEYYFSESEGVMKFGKTEEDPLDYEAIIVDEASMIDLLLMDGLVRAIKPGTRFIIVGDADQLPSVGVGNVLRDILDSEYIYSIRLKEIFRQAAESMIVVNAHKINKGEYPDCNKKDKDFFLLRRGSEMDMAETILKLCEERLPAHYKELDPMKDIQVLTPVRKGNLGCNNLNKRLQTVLNPPSPDLEEKPFGDKIFREGDKVMQIKNNYSLKWKKAGEFTEGEGVFNGDVGFVQKIDKEFGEMIVVFDEDKYVTYEFAGLDELEMAYAVTVHKSQGSEFPIVVMPVSWFPPVLANRNLLYTAVTRGKEAVILVGSENKMNAMVDNNQITGRNSGLALRLKGLI